MKTRIHNARILTMKPVYTGKKLSYGIIHGEVWIDKDTIIYIGEGSTEDLRRVLSNRIMDGMEVTIAKNAIWDKEIDASGNLVMPGFKNAHTHSPMTFLRSYADDMALHDWLYHLVFPAEAKLLPEDAYWLTRLAILEYLTSGVTTTFDMYYHREQVEKAFLDAGFRNVFCDTVMDVWGSIEQMEEDYEKYNQGDNSLISYRFGFHAEYTTDKELIKKIVKLAKKYQAPISTHCQETEYEVQTCVDKAGKTPIAYLDSLGVFDNGGTIFHGVVAGKQDIEILKSRGVVVVTNPASNLKIASGIAPINEYLTNGVEVAIGTDGAASNNALDMFREMYLTTVLQKVLCKDPEVVPAMEVLKMATIGGAKAMGLTDCDYLDVGKKADMIMIDLNQPNMQPLQNIAKNVVFSGSKSNVKMTMVNGKVLYQDGKFYQDVTKEKIYEKANEIAGRILHTV
jgi:5-methylthioadenosine/S-adenosylhomocysteine deaminase